MNTDEIDQLLVSASTTLTSILDRIHFEVIAYNGNLEIFLKGLFATALKENDKSNNIQWIVMDKRFSDTLEDMSIYLKGIPSKLILIEFKSTLSMDSAACTRAANKALEQISSYRQASHKYVIHYISVYSPRTSESNRRKQFVNAPVEIWNIYNKHNLQNNYSAINLVEHYKDQAFPLDIVTGNTITIYDKNDFKIECCICKI